MSGAPMAIGQGTLDDLDAIAAIYHHYVLTTAISFEIEPRAEDAWRDWFAGFGERGRHRLLVARRAGELIGYATSGPYRPRAAYGPSVETSVYVAPDHVGHGAGGALYGALLSELEREDVHRRVCRDRDAQPRVGAPARTVRLPPRRVLHRTGTEVRAILGCRVVRATLPGGGVHDRRVRGW